MQVNLRPSQQQILEYQGGKMGIMAVPGSGKTWTLSLLASEIIAQGWLQPGQEVLVVTLVNSAVDNFYQRVRSFLKQEELFLLNFRVRTLHGLAHDIVHERPELLNLGEDFQIIDEREAERIRQDAAIAWLRSHADQLLDWIDPQLDDNKRDWVIRDQLPKLVSEIALSFIRTAKDLRLRPERLQSRLNALQAPLPLAEMGCAIYHDYQRALTYRGAVDFDDLIWFALEILENDADLRQRLSERWPYILEDEAQDSSRLQEQILEQLTAEHGNWVRVGDPNQAIFETFTTANPAYLRDFIKRPEVDNQALPNSGRSTLSIINLANELARWVQQEYPLEAVRDALHAQPAIAPAPPGDPQPNPLDAPQNIHLVLKKYTPEQEIKAVAKSVRNWLANHPEETLAVLTPRNIRAVEIVDELKYLGVEVVESLLRSSSSTRQSAKALGNVLNYLSSPQSTSRLVTVYEAWLADHGAVQNPDGSWSEKIDPEQKDLELKLLRRCSQLEEYLWHTPGQDWLDKLQPDVVAPESVQRLAQFRQFIQRWQQAVTLPVDQLLLTLGQDWFTQPSDLALTHKLAVLLRQVNNAHPAWRLPELANELGVIASNERRFLGFSNDDSGFDPDQYKGKALVATIHKAKGLEWDRVYLMSVNNYDFPSGTTTDTYISEKWFIRDKLNMEAETLAQLETALSADIYGWYQEGQASARARLDYIRERLRLLYVGITRARKELVITWNNGRDGRRSPAEALMHLADYWEPLHHEPAE